jgi:SAM-dependent methyltransferase
VPGGKQIHRAIGKVVSRQTDGALNQVNDFARAVLMLLQAIVENRPAHETVLPDIAARLDSVLERMAAYERMPDGADAQSRALGARVKRLESALLDLRSTPAYPCAELQRAFVGSPDELTERLRPLAQRFAGLAPVLDLGCGGGEMLEILTGLGVSATGVDVDPDAVERATASGLSATRADARDYLGSIADATLGGVFAGHLLEQMRPHDAIDLLQMASRKLRPGGRLVIVGYNPASVHMQALAWFGDPGNVRPMPPALVEMLLRQWGFTEISVEAFGPEAQPLEVVPGVADGDGAIADAVNRNVERLNQLLFQPLAQAITATR